MPGEERGAQRPTSVAKTPRAGSDRGRPPASTRRYRAFLSHAHADRETVEWLREILERTWVPFAGNRRVFLDRESSRSGVLGEILGSALSDSDFLIVCGSRAARESSWVEAEIAHYVAEGRAGSILAAAVGSDDPWCLPQGIVELERAEGPLLLADLRERPRDWDRATRRERRAAALALLATILGFPDKHALAKTRLKTALLTAALVVVIGGLATGWFLDHRRWLRTPRGSIHRAVAGLRATVELERVDDDALLAGCRALGVLGREDALRHVASTFGSEQFRRLGLAAGLGVADCAAAQAELDGLDPRDASYWPQAYLYVARDCGRAPPPQARAACSDERWIGALLDTGAGAAAAAELENAQLTVDEAFPLLVRAALHGGLEASDIERRFGEWWSAVDASAFELRRLLEAWDRRGLLIRDELRPILVVVAELAAQMSPRSHLEWTLIQSFCARVSALGEPALDETSLGLALEYGTADLDSYSERAMAAAWADRGLALERVGKTLDADEAFARSLRCLAEPEASSSMGGEHRDVVVALCLADRWRDAVDLALKLPNTRTRAITLSEILSLRVERERLP